MVCKEMNKTAKQLASESQGRKKRANDTKERKTKYWTMVKIRRRGKTDAPEASSERKKSQIGRKS